MTQFQILFEDKSLLAIHKPENMPFHSDDQSVGIVRQVRDAVGSESLYPVHRLDRMTSGLMLFAKNPTVNSELSQLIASKQVEKYYLALSDRKPNKKQGMIKGDMEKSRRASYKLVRSMANPATTFFFMKALNLQANKRYGFVLKPETGKTHQLRVALKSIGSPILGDTRYGGEEAGRGYLHAYFIRFVLNNHLYSIQDPFLEGEQCSLDDFRCSFELLDKPYQMNWPGKAFLLD